MERTRKKNPARRLQIVAVALDSTQARRGDSGRALDKTIQLDCDGTRWLIDLRDLPPMARLLRVGTEVSS